MAGQYYAPDSSDLQVIYVDDYALIDQQANTGSLWGFGQNLYGGLGDQTLISKSSPIQVIGGGTNWKQVSAGGTCTSAIKTDGTLWSWGRNNNGQLGDNTIVNKSSPVQVSGGGTNWKQVSAGGFHTTAIKTDGTLWTWGSNSLGQLGDNTIVSKSTPVQVTMGGVANTNWKQVVGGGQNYTAAIKTDGTLWSWGYNAFGNLGDNTIVDKSTPVQVSGGGTNWKQVSCALYHTAAIKTDGTLWLWGFNLNGGLGDNTRVNKSTPVQVSGGGTNWKQVACILQQTAAIKTDGTLWLWGRNDFGQLGLNDIIYRSTPVQVIGGGTNWKQVCIGSTSYHTAAIKTDGTLWVWGRNDFGQLGVNTTANISSPIQTVSGGFSLQSTH